MTATLDYALDELPALAARLVAEPGQPRAWFIDGDLGAGKTTLVQACCRVLGVSQPVQSPTFGLAHVYARPGGEVYHLDLYRLTGGLPEALEAGLLDYVEAGEWCFVEWAETVAELRPERYLHLWIHTLPDGRRRLSIHRHEPA